MLSRILNMSHNYELIQSVSGFMHLNLWIPKNKKLNSYFLYWNANKLAKEKHRKNLKRILRLM
jgi:hypothetical protein